MSGEEETQAMEGVTCAADAREREAEEAVDVNEEGGGDEDRDEDEGEDAEDDEEGDEDDDDGQDEEDEYEEEDDEDDDLIEVEEGQHIPATALHSLLRMIYGRQEELRMSSGSAQSSSLGFEREGPDYPAKLAAKLDDTDLAKMLRRACGGNATAGLVEPPRCAHRH